MAGMVSLHRALATRSRRRFRRPQIMLIDLPLSLALLALTILVLYAAWWAR